MRIIKEKSFSTTVRCDLWKILKVLAKNRGFTTGEFIEHMFWSFVERYNLNPQADDGSRLKKRGPLHRKPGL